MYNIGQTPPALGTCSCRILDWDKVIHEIPVAVSRDFFFLFHESSPPGRGPGLNGFAEKFVFAESKFLDKLAH